MLPYCAAFGIIFAMPMASAQILSTWTGGASVDRFGNEGNWDEGVPGAGDTGNVGGSFRVEVGVLNEMNVGATINMNDSSFIERNNSSGLAFSGTLNFNDSSALISSDFRLQENSTVNWASSGTFTDAGASNQPNFAMLAGSEVNFSAGTWELFGESNVDVSLLMRAGTFNATGGTLILETRLRVGQDSAATFNLGKDASLYSGGLFMDQEGSLFDFEVDASYHIASMAQFNARLDDGFIAIEGIVQSDMENFTTESVTEDLGFGDVDYTRITAIPEPRAFAAMAGLVALLAFFVRDRRRQRS